MQLTKEGLKFIFGLKLKEFRTQKELSLKEVAQKSGLSVSYLNEIEKGKKYPKAEKIVKIAEALEVDFDKLVSLELNDQLRPLLLLLKTKILKEFPLEHFGISHYQIFDFFSHAPLKFGAFITTLYEMTNTYDMQVEQFYTATLRSYLEMNQNYFPEIEEKVDEFLDGRSAMVNTEFLTNILTKNYGYKIEKIDFNQMDGLESLISILKNKTLYINKLLSDPHVNFILAKEIGYNVLNKGKEIRDTFLIENATSFEQVLEDAKAGYFGGALLLNRFLIKNELEAFFSEKKWNLNSFKKIIEKFATNEQTFLYRLTEILPKHFNLKQLFLIRFNHNKETKQNYIANEIHLSKRHKSHSVAFNEHYCERWITLALINELDVKSDHETNGKVVVGVQRSRFYGSTDEYLCLSAAYTSKVNPNINTCVTLGILLDDYTKKVINFWDDDFIIFKEVSKTCERCQIKDCSQRKSPPLVINKIESARNKKRAIKEFLN